MTRRTTGVDRHVTGHGVDQAGPDGAAEAAAERGLVDLAVDQHDLAALGRERGGHAHGQAAGRPGSGRGVAITTWRSGRSGGDRSWAMVITWAYWSRVAA